MIKKKVKFSKEEEEEQEHTPLITINHDHITSKEFQKKSIKKKEGKHDVVILEDLKQDDLEELTDQLRNDDDIIIVKEFLHGAKASLSIDLENIKRMLAKI